MNRTKQIVKVSFLGIFINIVLVIFKSIVGFVTNSIAIILDAVNNLTDVLSSIITIIGTKLSSKAPDKEHPYGHGRIEYFSSVIIAVIVLLAGLSSLKESALKIINPVKANYTIFSLFIILVAVFSKLLLGVYVKKEGKKLNSKSLIASGLDAISDAFISLTTFIGALLSILFNISIEGYLGAMISIFIIKSAIEILKDTINDMIGVRADSELTKKIKRKISSYEEVLGVYDLTLHSYGPNKIIATAHIQVNDTMNAREIHRLTRGIMIDIFEKFGIIITLGIYASNTEGEYGDIWKYIKEITSQYKNIVQIHGFYVDEEKMKIFFDVIFNFNESEQDKIIEEINNILKEKYPNYDYHIMIDNYFSD